MSGLYEDVKHLFEFAESDVKRVGTGIDRLDHIIRGVAPGEVCMILGSSGSGKSLLGQNIINNNREIPSIFFSMEMPAMQALIRLYAMWSGKSAPEVQDYIDDGTPPDDMWEMIPDYLYHRVEDQSGLSTGQMSAVVAEYEDDFGFKPDYVVIDYLELVGGTAVHAEGVQGVDAQATMIKDWAKAEQIRVFLLHQTNRSEKDYKPPTKDSVRYGGYTQSDFVIGLWQPSKDPGLDFADRLRLKNTICANVLKNRPFFELTEYLELPVEPSLTIWQERKPYEFRDTNDSVSSERKQGSESTSEPSTSGDELIGEYFPGSTELI